MTTVNNILEAIFTKEIHLSSGQLSPVLAKLMQDHPLKLKDGLSNEELLNTIAQYVMLHEYIDKLGWVEHTSDWDPLVKITLKDGTEYENMAGYRDIKPIEPLSDTITLEYLHWDLWNQPGKLGAEPTDLIINIQDIDTIQYIYD